MSSLPVLLKNPHILLIGGGPVACRKARVLRENTIRFTLIAARMRPELRSTDPGCSLIIKQIEPADLAPFHIIIDATGRPEVAALVLAEKERRFVLVNIVDVPEQCDFYFSALLNYGPLKIAVSTDGASPAIGQVVRDRIRSLIPAELGGLVSEKSLERRRGVIEAGQARQQALDHLARVFLVGCGPGDANLLTLQAYHCIRQAEVVLYDHLVPQQILDLVPEGVEQVYVGKQKQAHSLRQDDINQLILGYARQGLRVARLKSGDPYVFGRGAEEARFLLQQGIAVEVIAGLSSAMAGPAAAGIPLTARGYAANVSIVSAHLAGSRLNTGWLPMLQLPDHTTVVLMGLSFSAEIAAQALAAGVPSDLPVAIVSNASRENQRTLITTLQDLPERSGQAQGPAVLVFGNVVNLHHVLPRFVPHPCDDSAEWQN